MPRKSRRSIHSNFSHVLVQGINQEYIFNEEKYKKKYMELIKVNMEKYEIKIIAYAIMDNHAHLLVYCEKIENLSKAMHRINQLFAMYYNKEQKRVGYVFRNRYTVQEIMDRRQLYCTISYIHHNPVKAKIVKRMEDYQYSSYQEYIDLTGFITKETIILVFETMEYRKIYDSIHLRNESIEIQDVKDKEENYAKIINDYREEIGESIETIKKDNQLLYPLIIQLKQNCGLTQKEIGEILGVDKNRMTRIIRKNKD